MSRTVEIREPNVQCDITFPEGMVSVYADDMSQLGLGVPNSRVLFHTLDLTPVKTAQDGTLIEQRTAVLQLTMPTLSLVNFAKHILAAASQSSEQMASGFSEYGANLKVSIDGVSTPSIDASSDQP